jgi:hypothetical protein
MLRFDRKFIMTSVHSIYGTRIVPAAKSSRLMSMLLVPLTITMMPASLALAADGDILPPWDSDWAHTPYRTYYNGKYYVTAQVDSIPLDCASFMYNCQVQVQLLSKGTAWYSTWYEHSVQTIFSPQSMVYATPRLACGNHYWKLRTRIIYQSAKTTTTEVTGFYESSSNINVKPLWKVIIEAGARQVYGGNASYKQSVKTSEIISTPWVDVDQTPGTIYTSC